jgi:hypothetical protein
VIIGLIYCPKAFFNAGGSNNSPGKFYKEIPAKRRTRGVITLIAVQKSYS